MTLSGHQPEYLPYIGFFTKMMLCETFVLVDHVQYHKKSWQNRNRIRTKDGELLLTVPVITKGKFDQAIQDVVINNSDNWCRKHLRSIVSSYQKAPYFKKYIGFFEEIYAKDWEKLADLNIAIIQYMADQLAINVRIVKSSDFKPLGQKTDLLIDMCEKLEFTAYLSGAGGRTYIDEEKFKAKNLKSLYVEFEHPVYKQLHDPFMPNMSVVDLMFNHGKERSRQIVKQSGGIGQ